MAGCAVYALVCVLLGRIVGAPFVVPAERISPALGLPAAVPVGVAGAGYVALQIARRTVDRHRGHDVDGIARVVATDLAFLLLFVGIVYLHFHIKTWMPLLRPHLFDDSYFQIDQRYKFVIDAGGVLRALLARVLPAPDLWYQGAQAGLLILSFWLHALGNRRWHYHNLVALLLIMMLGPLSYLIAPAVGPFIFETGPNAVATASQHAMYAVFQQVQAGGSIWLAQHGGEHLTAAVAAMPSLHVTLACVVPYYAHKARSALTPLLLFLAGWIFIESVVSRWHYLIDLPAGVALAAFVVVVTNWACARRGWIPERSATG
jgi:hypothetical protein